MKTCSHPGCIREVHAKGLCVLHYNRRQKYIIDSRAQAELGLELLQHLKGYVNTDGYIRLTDVQHFLVSKSLIEEVKGCMVSRWK